MELILIILFAAALFVAWFWRQEEKELRDAYDLFGTTGFWDVDARYRRKM